MKNIKSEVHDILDIKPAVRKCLTGDLINQRALARQIREDLSQEASLDAIISAIRRYPLDREGESDKAIQLIKGMKISTKNKIAGLRLKNKSEVHDLLGEVASSIDFGSGETLKINMALQSVKIIFDQRNLERILEIIPEKLITNTTKNLSELIVTFPKGAKGTPGLASRITTEFALNDINIIEIMSSIPELIVILDESDTKRAYEILEHMTED